MEGLGFRAWMYVCMYACMEISITLLPMFVIVVVIAIGLVILGGLPWSTRGVHGNTEQSVI